VVAKKNNIVIVFCILSCLSCGKKVIITKDYLSNRDWPEQYQGFLITRITPVDSTISIANKPFYVSDLNKHVIDSSFCFYQSFQSNHIKSKIHFNKKTDSATWIPCFNIKTSIDTIGSLKLHNWYAIKQMGNDKIYYVFIDSRGRSHVYSSGPGNW
jgi:hypothetical protein